MTFRGTALDRRSSVGICLWLQLCIWLGLSALSISQQHFYFQPTPTLFLRQCFTLFSVGIHFLEVHLYVQSYLWAWSARRMEH